MASPKRSIIWPAMVLVIGVIVAVLALPQPMRSWIPVLGNASIHFGLDLAGGTQLDFRISEQEMLDQRREIEAEIAQLEADGTSPERLAILQSQITSIDEQQRNLLEAIRTVLERRINSLGVSEATITPSVIGSEKHLLVECPGVVDVQQCIATVGKTIALEFKEEHTEGSAEYEAQMRRNVDEALRRMRESGATLLQLGEDLSGQLGISYIPSDTYFRDTTPPGLEDIWTATPASGVLRRDATITVQEQDAEGNIVPREIPGIFLTELLEPKTQTGRTVNEAPKAFALLAEQDGLDYRAHEKTPLDVSVSPRIIGALRAMQPGKLQTTTMDDGTSRVLFMRSFAPGREQADVSHILIGYQGAAGAQSTVTRSKEEALALATQLKARIDNGESFVTLARQFSEGETAAQGGKIDPIVKGGTQLPAFEQVAFSQATGTVSAPVETQFGYHLIRTDKAPYTVPDTAGYDELIVSNDANGSRANQILADLQSGKVQSTEDVVKARSIFFSLLPTGWKDTPLDGKHFRSATVTLDPISGIPVVQIAFDDEGGKLFQELTARNINKRLAIFVGGDLVSAPVVQGEIIGGTAVITGSGNFDEARLLAQELNTGAIPAPIFLSGQRTVEATLGADALRTSLQAAAIGIVLLMVYMLLLYRVLGVLANISLGLYALLYFVLMKVPLGFFSDQYVVLTLAGMAGIILSTGMAVDANVLIFERIKEELRKGRSFSTALETGFTKAWPSIRDGNVSTLITCAILFLVGTSIVRGFAITLGIGVFLSMFTAITVTKWLARKLAKTPMAQRTSLFGVRTSAVTQA